MRRSSADSHEVSVFRGEAGPYSVGFVVGAFLSPLLMLWALIGGARVECLSPKWASFHVGLSAGTAAVVLLALRHFGLVFDWVSENFVNALGGDRLKLSNIAAALLSQITGPSPGPPPNHIHDLLALRGAPHTLLVTTL